MLLEICTVQTCMMPVLRRCGSIYFTLECKINVLPFSLLLCALGVEHHLIYIVMLLRQLIFNFYHGVKIGKFRITLEFVFLLLCFISVIENVRTRQQWHLIATGIHHKCLLGPRPHFIYIQSIKFIHHFIHQLLLVIISGFMNGLLTTILIYFNWSLLIISFFYISNFLFFINFILIKLMKQKFCLSSVASFKQINQSAVNKSGTKQTFSFTKTPRFQSIKPICNKSTYGGDFIQRKVSGAGIGYGSKYDFTKNSIVSPASTIYNVRSQFEDNKQKSRGRSIGLSRDAVTFNQYISRESMKVPDPTKYQYDKPQRLKQPSYSLRSRTKVHDRSMTIDPQVKNPGPGAYHEPKSTKVSKFAQLSYGTSRSDRFLSAANGVPGAGHYQNIEPISNVGKYSMSKHVGGTQAKFGRTSRATFLDDAVKNQKAKPGPGFYRSPSQFGQYDGDVYFATGKSGFNKRT